MHAAQATLQVQIDLSAIVDLIVERVSERVASATTIGIADLVGGVVSAHRLRRCLAIMRSWHGINTKAAEFAFKRAQDEARMMEVALARAGLESDLVCDMVTARKTRPDVDALDGYSREDVYKVHPINPRPSKHASRRQGHRQAAASAHSL